MKIIIDVNYCSECKKVSYDLSAINELDLTVAKLSLDSWPKVNDVAYMLIDHYIEDFVHDELSF